MGIETTAYRWGVDSPRDIFAVPSHLGLQCAKAHHMFLSQATSDKTVLTVYLVSRAGLNGFT